MSAASAYARTVPQIARRLGVSRQNVQRIADLLVTDGAATFESNPDHKSSPFLALTRRGHAALAEITRAAAASHARVARRLGATDLAPVHRSLRRLIEATSSD
jgi:DNA-binding MarR family transcriptional regulator